MNILKNKRVVITGIGIVSSIGMDKKEVVENLMNGQHGISNIKSFNTDKFISQIGGEVKNYDPEKYFSKSEIDKYDKCSQLAIISIQEAINESKIDKYYSLQNVGLTMGTCNGGINSIEETYEFEKKNLKKYPFFSQTDNIAKHFEINGPVSTINTACAASGNAIGLGLDLIKQGYTDCMIVGGADAMSLSVYSGFNALQALNKFPSSPYSEEYGLSLGEGAAFLTLETYENAKKRNAKIYGEICGYGLSSDAYHETAPHPEGIGIQKAVNQALKEANIEKRDIDYINTHGTGTKSNDYAELNGLENLFGKDLFSSIPVSSSKAYFGHNLGAAAAIELTTTLLFMEHGLVPATINFTKPREKCDRENIIVNKPIEKRIEYFLCNNSAFGGHNVSLVIKKNNLSKGKESKLIKEKPVYITGLGTSIDILDNNYKTLFEYMIQNEFLEKESKVKLKNYNKNLYERRMNNLTQFSIIAANETIIDSGINEKEDLGLIYGTSKGSLKSAEKYLKSIKDKGPEFASSVYFPDMVLNSTAGKISKKLQITDFSTSLSTGGNEGIFTTIYGYEIVKRDSVKKCLVGAGDENSNMADKINEIFYPKNHQEKINEGSTFLLLSNEEKSNKKYSEIIGSYLNFGLEKEHLVECIEKALKDSKINFSDIDIIFWDNNGTNNLELSSFIDMSKLKKESLLYSFNKKFVFESTGSINNIYMASEVLGNNTSDLKGVDAKENKKLEIALIISQSINGNNGAIVLKNNKK